jgi:hypothetical protein
MFLSNWRLLFRRWYVVILGLLATGLLCFLAVQVVPVKYQATSAVVLLPPETATTQQGGNPYLALGGLDTVGGVVSKAMADRKVQLGIRAAGGTGTYTLVPDLAAGGPVLLITAEDVTPGGALATLDVIAKQLPRTLASLQTSSGVRDSSLIRSKPITRDDVAQPVRKSQIRALFAAAAAGLAGTVLLASVLDGYLGRRSDERRRRRERALQLAGADYDTEPPADTVGTARELTAAERDRLANRLAGRSGVDARDAVTREGPAREVPVREAPVREPIREVPPRGVRADRDIPARADRDIPSRADRDIAARADRDVASRADRDIPARDRGIPARGDRDVPARGDREVPARPARVHNLTPLTGSVRNGSVPNGSAPNGSVHNGSGNGSGPNGSVPNGSVPNGSVPNGSVPNGSAPRGSMNNGSLANGSGSNGSGGNGSGSHGAGNGAAHNGANVTDPSIDEPTEIARIWPDRVPFLPPAVEQDTVDFRRLAAELREARADGRFHEPE